MLKIILKSAYLEFIWNPRNKINWILWKYRGLRIKVNPIRCCSNKLCLVMHFDRVDKLWWCSYYGQMHRKLTCLWSLKWKPSWDWNENDRKNPSDKTVENQMICCRVFKNCKDQNHHQIYSLIQSVYWPYVIVVT